MPANRRRTEHWRRSLWQVFERNGALEISVRRGGGASDDAAPKERPVDLVWRVKILKLTDDEIVVETPNALGQTVRFAPGVQLACVLSIGQNRWMFAAEVTGEIPLRAQYDRTVTAMRLAMPEHVERCQRRNFYRVSTVEIHLPMVTCWPLLDPTSAVVAEKANEVQIAEAIAGSPAAAKRSLEATLALPEVGPPFHATLANIGGGGIGLIVEPESNQSLTRHRLFWMRIALPPDLPAPLAVTARLVHTHIDSTQRTYAGFAFEFGHNKSHQKFVVDQLTRFVALQLERKQCEVQPGRKAS